MLRRAPFSLSLLASALALPSSTLHKRTCYGSADASCNFLIQNCVNSPGLWYSDSCVAAATCAGVNTLLEALCCADGECLDPAQESSLDYNLYAGIVGDCAWATGGCPITQQNYIDFYYRTLTETGSTVWPTGNDEVIGWWNAVAGWTATGSSIPYTNFDDWLHYSSGAVSAGSTGGSTGGGSTGGGSTGGGSTGSGSGSGDDNNNGGGIVIIPPIIGGGGGGAAGGGGTTGGGAAGGSGGGAGGGAAGGAAGGSGGGSGGSGGGSGGGTGSGDGGDGGDDGDDGDDDDDDDDPFCLNEDTEAYKREDSYTEIFERLTTNKTVATYANTSSELAARGMNIAWEYDIDCNVFPNICENWCYYVYCKAGTGWVVTVERNAGNRDASECKNPNRCSYKCKGRMTPKGLKPTWSLNPNQNWQCDEQPKNTNAEGGPGAATRCMTERENGDEGLKWQSYINGANGGTYLNDGTKVTVVLANTKTSGFCASYGGKGTTKCKSQVTAADALVSTLVNGHGSDDGIRQR